MAMTACRECGKPVSTEAKNCPHCGTSAPSKKKSKGGIGKWLLIFFAIGLVATVLPKREGASTASAPPKKVEAKATPAKKELPPECTVRKKDGTLDPRECDLEELCKDWIYYRRKAWEYAQKGNRDSLAEAQQGFAQTNAWLSAYREEDVQACLLRHGA